jgi:hypothetical protein
MSTYMYILFRMEYLYILCRMQYIYILFRMEYLYILFRIKYLSILLLVDLIQIRLFVTICLLLRGNFHQSCTLTNCCHLSPILNPRLCLVMQKGVKRCKKSTIARFGFIWQIVSNRWLIRFKTFVSQSITKLYN